MDICEKLYKKTGGFMKGICHPTDDTDMLTGAGIEWVRWDVPYPFEADGTPAKELTAYKNRSRMFKNAGIRTVAISPYPNEFIKRGIDVTTSEGLEKAGDICGKMAEYLKDVVDCWQVTNELMNGFRAPLTMGEIMPYVAACAKGIRKYVPDVCIGQNSCPPWDPVGCENFDTLQELTGKDFFDYLGFDIYFGSWMPGGPNDYEFWIQKLYDYAKMPLILMEFGFSSKGNFYRKEKWNKLLNKYGFADEDEMLANPDRFIKVVLDELSPNLAKKARLIAPGERSAYLKGAYVHLLKCWPAETGDLPHSEEGQAQFFKETLPAFQKNPALGGAMIYCNVDAEKCFDCGHSDCPIETGWGILQSDLTKKKAYYAIKDIWGNSRK